MAMLGKPNGAGELNDDLLAFASTREYDKRVDCFFVHRYLQAAILDGLKAGGAQNYLNAWSVEMKPLDPIPQRISL
jgi:hypothetical protein